EAVVVTGDAPRLLDERDIDFLQERQTSLDSRANRGGRRRRDIEHPHQVRRGRRRPQAGVHGWNAQQRPFAADASSLRALKTAGPEDCRRDPRSVGAVVEQQTKRIDIVDAGSLPEGGRVAGSQWLWTG